MSYLSLLEFSLISLLNFDLITSSKLSASPMNCEIHLSWISMDKHIKNYVVYWTWHMAAYYLLNFLSPLSSRKFRYVVFRPFIDHNIRLITPSTSSLFIFSKKLVMEITSISPSYMWSGSNITTKSIPIAWDKVWLPTEYKEMNLKNVTLCIGILLLWWNSFRQWGMLTASNNNAKIPFRLGTKSN